jgi:hypothetical protein
MSKKKNALLALISVLSVVLVASSAISATSTSHLVPEEGYFGLESSDPYYEAVSERLLSPNRGWKCQAVFLPSFAEERAVYIKYENSNSGTPPVVVAVKMERSLWGEMIQVLKADSNDKRFYNISPEYQRKALLKIPTKVDRFESPIDRDTAKALELTWEAILMRVHHPNTTGHWRNRDGATYHFTNFTWQGDYLTGKVWSPPEGTPAHDLVRLATDLWFYPTLKEPERKTAAQELKNKAQELLERVKAMD